MPHAQFRGCPCGNVGFENPTDRKAHRICWGFTTSPDSRAVSWCHAVERRGPGATRCDRGRSGPGPADTGLWHALHARYGHDRLHRHHQLLHSQSLRAGRLLHRPRLRQDPHPLSCWIHLQADVHVALLLHEAIGWGSAPRLVRHPTAARPIWPRPSPIGVSVWAALRPVFPERRRCP